MCTCSATSSTPCDVPFVVVNDGEVTALAGVMRVGAGFAPRRGDGLEAKAGGYVTSDRLLTSWLNELAFVPIYLSPAAPRDDWSGDAGVGAQYLSQRAVARLLPAAGIETPRDMDQPAQLVATGAGRSLASALSKSCSATRLGCSLLTATNRV